MNFEPYGTPYAPALSDKQHEIKARIEAEFEKYKELHFWAYHPSGVDKLPVIVIDHLIQAHENYQNEIELLKAEIEKLKAKKKQPA